MKIVVTAGDEIIAGSATRTTWHTLSTSLDSVTRIKSPHKPFSTVIVFYSRVITILETVTFHLQFNSDASLSLNERPTDNGLCTYEVSLCALTCSTIEVKHFRYYNGL